MEVTLKQFFSIGDGRLSTEIGDVYKMLNFIFSENLTTILLPMYMEKLVKLNPKWFSDAVSVINEIKEIENTDDFNQLMKAIDLGYSDFKIKLIKL